VVQVVIFVMIGRAIFMTVVVIGFVNFMTRVVMGLVRAVTLAVARLVRAKTLVVIGVTLVVMGRTNGVVCFTTVVTEASTA